MSPVLTRPLGLSFEVAAPVASHRNRTDIACFVGRVARRAVPDADALQRVPEVVARWLEGEGWSRIADVEVRNLWVDTSGTNAFAQTLTDAVDAAIARATAAGRATDTARLEAERGDLVTLLQHTSATALGALLAACRSLTPVPEAVLEDLRLRGFSPGSLLGTDTLAAWLRLQKLTNLPVLLESFEQFDALFAWERRPVETSADAAPSVVVCPLGAAVRAFFAEGGRRCYVVRTGDPVPLFDTAEAQFTAIAATTAAAGPWQRPGADALSAVEPVPALPGITPVMKLGLLASVSAVLDPVPSDAGRWVGAEHVFGLGDVCFLCVPDLPGACAEPIPQSVPPAQVFAVAEVFSECAAPATPVEEPLGRRLPPPRLDSLGLDVWRACLMHAVRLLANGDRAFHRRDVQLIASLPLTGEGRDMPDPDGWVAWMDDNEWFRDSVRRPAGGGDAPAIVVPALLDPRVQLGYPWLRTRDSADCQGGVEAPEGTLCGVLARSALLQGSFRLAAHQRLLRAIDVLPALDFSRATRGAVTTAIGNVTLADRVCLLAPSARGFELASDVTCAGDPLLRRGSVRRLMDVVLRAARTLGEEIAFDPNGEALWAHVRTRLSDLGRLLLAAGALSTDAGARAFVVRCGRDTMTQNDIDAGRLVAEVEMVPAQPVTRILVVLALRDARPGGAVRRAA